MSSVKSLKRNNIHVSREKGNSLKALTIATLASLVMFGTPSAQAEENNLSHKEQGEVTGFAADINPEDFVQDSYGNQDGAIEKYFKFSKDYNNNYILSEVANQTDASFTVKYAPSYYSTETRINNNLNSTNANNVYFSSDTDNYRWGAINNSKNLSDVNINADFVGYRQTSGDLSNDWNRNGAAILNTGSIGNINANFIQNTSTISGGGTIIINDWGTINNITGDFIANSANGSTAWGGGIYSTSNSVGINSIYNSNFIGNSTISSTYSAGGALFAIGTINSVTNTNFINNHIKGNSDVARGGAIGLGNSSSQYGIINNLNANFIGNYAITAGSNAEGGAISLRNSGSKVTSLSGYFNGNYVYGRSANGGAIWNNGGTIGSINNSSFLNNHAQTNSTSYTPYGGAIWTSSNITFNSTDGFNSTFSGNYVQKGTSGTKLNEAIYVNSSSATLTFNAKTNGQYTFDDYFNGVSGYNVIFTGDNTGKVNLYNDVKNGDVSTNTITMNLANGEMHDYSMYTLNSNANTKWNIDIDINNKKADTITTSASGSTGRVTLDGFNFITSDFGSISPSTFKIQVLKTQNSNLQLALSETAQAQLGDTEYAMGTETETTYDEIQTNTNWSHVYNEHITEKAVYGQLGLATTSTTNDSIGLTITRVVNGETTDNPMGDTLALVNQSALTTRNFNASNVTDTYTLSSALGTTAAGTLNINGQTEENNHAILNLNNKGAFTLSENTTLNLNDVRLTGGSNLITVTNENAKVNIKDSYIDGSITGGSKFDLKTSGKSTLNGNVVNINYTNEGTTTANGTITGSVLNKNGANLSVKADNIVGDVTNNGTLNFTGGTNSNEIGGTGLTVTTGTITNNALINQAVANSGTLTSSAANLGNAVLNTGTLNLSGNLNKTITGTGTTKVNNSLTFSNNANIDGTLDLNNGTLNLSSGEITNHNIGNLKGTGNISLDVDFTETDTKLDSLTAAANDSANLTISNLNSIGTKRDFEYKILNGTDNNVTLGISDSVLNDYNSTGVNTTTDVDVVTQDTNWSDTFNTTTTVTTTTKNLSVKNNNTLLYQTNVSSVQSVASNGDTLALVNQSALPVRNFSTNSENDTYTPSTDLGTTGAGTMTINGVTGGETRSTLDFDSHKGFELDNDNTELVLKNIEVKNSSALVSATGTSTNNKIVLDNVNIHDNGTGITTYGDVDIKGNSTISDDITVLGATSAIDVDGSDVVTLDSTITGGAGKTLTLHDGTVNLTDNASVIAIDLTVQDVELNISDNASLAGLDATFNGNNTLNIKNENSLSGMNPTFNDITTLNIENNSIGTLAFGNVNLNGLLKMSIDADLANSKIDQLTATNATVGPNGAIEVQKINLLSPTTEQELSLLFTNNLNLANVVSYTGENEIVYSPIYKYTTTYEKKADGGYFKFVLPSKALPAGGSSSSGSPVYSDFNPAIMSAPVAAQGVAQVGMNHVFGTSFEHADGFMPLPANERMSMLRGNFYAINDVNTTEQILKNTGVSTDFNDNMDLDSFTDLDHTNKALWVKPYTSFERINLHNGPKVDMISYGTLFGGDSDFRKLKNGWANVGTLYIGYNGASIDYSGVDTNFNGGVLGITESFYKKNFFTAITANVGAGFAEAHTMYGHEDMTMLMAGVASKTGYNFEFKEGKFIIQPCLLMSYSMINTFDYKNAAGVKINSDPLHTIQLNPNIKFIANLKHEWQPYVSVGMVYNLMNETKVTANGVKLPESSTKPYVEYGVGVQKHFGETFSGYGQAMVRNGGRNGIALSAGFRWALSDKKVKKDNKNVIKDDKNIKETVVQTLPNDKDSISTPQEVVNKTVASKEDTLQPKAVVKSVKENAKARNLARYRELIGG